MPAQSIPVPAAERGHRLDRFLTTALPAMTIDRARALCGAGRVRIKGKAARAERRLWGGETIEIDLPPPTRVAPVGGRALPVLYEDADLVIVDKPAGLVVPREGDRPSVVGILAAQLEGLDVGGRGEPGVVHRLDRETSGCLLLARTDRAADALKCSFETHQVEKRYSALVLGEPPDERRIETPYARDPKDARRFTTRIPSARRAALSFTVRERFSDAAWLDVRLQTGRTHQIRVQLAEAGWPVIGDAIYGPAAVRAHPVAVELGRHALHAWRLALPHPISGVRIETEAPLPADLSRTVQTLRKPAADGR